MKICSLTFGVFLAFLFTGCGSKVIEIRNDPNLKNMTPTELMDKVGFFKNNCRNDIFYKPGNLTDSNTYVTMQKYCSAKNGKLVSLNQMSYHYCIDDNQDALFKVNLKWGEYYYSQTYGRLEQATVCLYSSYADEYKNAIVQSKREEQAWKNKLEKEEKEKQALLDKYSKDALKGDMIAQYNLGVIYQFGGLGQKQNDLLAFKWYEKSAIQGYDEAQLNVGYIYVHGIGVKQDKIKAYEYFLKAAKQGNKKAQDNLDILCKESPWACKN